MSRIGRNPINVPSGVKVEVDANNVVTVTGPKGTLQREISKKIEVKVEDGKVLVLNNNAPADKQARAFHGLFRQLVANMVTGVSEGYVKKLTINGVGYKINLKNDKEATLNIGFSHPVEVVAPEGITLEAEKNTLTVKGIDKELVGQFASTIRSFKPVEPYHAYGIMYSDEVVIRKESKTGKK